MITQLDGRVPNVSIKRARPPEEFAPPTSASWTGGGKADIAGQAGQPGEVANISKSVMTQASEIRGKILWGKPDSAANSDTNSGTNLEREHFSREKGLSEPREFNNHGIRFLYPPNWLIEEEGYLEGKYSVTACSPTGGFWTVSLHPRHADPRDLVQAAVAAMRQEYDSLESEPYTQQVAAGNMVGAEMHFFYLDLVCVCRVQAVRTDSGTFVFFCQTVDHDFETLDRVFQALTISCLNYVPKLSYWD